MSLQPVRSSIFLKVNTVALSKLQLFLTTFNPLCFVILVSLLAAPSTGSPLVFFCMWLLDMRSQQETHVIAFFENITSSEGQHLQQRLAPTIFGSQWQSFGARSSASCLMRLTLAKRAQKLSKSANQTVQNDFWNWHQILYQSKLQLKLNCSITFVHFFQIAGPHCVPYRAAIMHVL